MIELSKSTFQRIAQVAKSESGIDLSESKVGMVHARLRRRILSLGLTDYEGYCDILEGSCSRGVGERQNLIDALTTNVTSFFREPHHFSLLTDKMQAALDGNPGHRFRIWSAGCSDGSEPLSICLSIAKKFPGLKPINVEILATDIDCSALGRARENLYPIGGLSREEESLCDMKHIIANQSHFSLDQNWFERISYRRENLLKPHKPVHYFDAIFCRNVTIYFDVETSGNVQRSLLSALSPGGLLCLGHSERLVGRDCTDKCVRVGPSAYVKSTKEDHNVSA